MDLFTLKKLMGHAFLKTTELYVATSMEKAESEAMEGFVLMTTPPTIKIIDMKTNNFFAMLYIPPF